MNPERQAVHEYLHHLKNRAQGQRLMAEEGRPGGREKEILDELNEVSRLLDEAYRPILAALGLAALAGERMPASIARILDAPPTDPDQELQADLDEIFAEAE